MVCNLLIDDEFNQTILFFTTKTLNKMKTTKIIYWVTTSIICLFAAVAHIAINDPLSNTIMAIVFFGLLLLSYTSFHKLLRERA